MLMASGNWIELRYLMPCPLHKHWWTYKRWPTERPTPLDFELRTADGRSPCNLSQHVDYRSSPQVPWALSQTVEVVAL